MLKTSGSACSYVYAKHIKLNYLVLDIENKLDSMFYSKIASSLLKITYMEKISAIFAGQGSQYAGMGRKLISYKPGKETFQIASDVLKMDIEFLCCNGTDEELSRTEVTQPAILTCSIAAYRIIKSDEFSNSQIVGQPKFSATAGLSVGEYSALVASGSLNFADAIQIVQERGRLMSEAAKINPGVMVAVIGLDAEIVKSICESASSVGVVQPANYNSPAQIVISGEKQAVEKAIELAKSAGAKRCIPLDVSGAFHSPLMRIAESGLRKVLNMFSFSTPDIPFIANVTGDYVKNPKEIVEMLALQLSSSIQWEAVMRKMLDEGISTFIEFGPGKVLSGLIRRMSKDVKVYSSDELL